MKKLMFVVLAVFGLVSVSFAYKLNETQESRVEYFKAVVAELEDLKKQGKLPYEGKSPLREGKLFLEFVEKLKQSPETKCREAVRDVMSDDDNNDKYHYYIWADLGMGGCLSSRSFVDDVRKIEKELGRKLVGDK